jgi:hypothetical protein
MKPTRRHRQGHKAYGPRQGSVAAPAVVARPPPARGSHGPSWASLTPVAGRPGLSLRTYALGIGAVALLEVLRHGGADASASALPSLWGLPILLGAVTLLALAALARLLRPWLWRQHMGP